MRKWKFFDGNSLKSGFGRSCFNSILIYSYCPYHRFWGWAKVICGIQQSLFSQQTGMKLIFHLSCFLWKHKGFNGPNKGCHSASLHSVSFKMWLGSHFSRFAFSEFQFRKKQKRWYNISGTTVSWYKYSPAWYAGVHTTPVTCHIPLTLLIRNHHTDLLNYWLVL